MLKSLMKGTPDEIVPGLYLGNLSHSNDKDTLSSLGIETIIQIGGSFYPPPHEGSFKYHPLAFGDSPTADLPAQLEVALPIMIDTLQERK